MNTSCSDTIVLFTKRSFYLFCIFISVSICALATAIALDAPGIPRALSLSVAIAAAYSSIVILKRLIIPEPRIIVTSNGFTAWFIRDRLVAWHDVDLISLSWNGNTAVIDIYLRDIRTYLSSLNWWQRIIGRANLREGVDMLQIPAGGLAGVTPEELESLFRARVNDSDKLPAPLELPVAGGSASVIRPNVTRRSPGELFFGSWGAERAKMLLALTLGLFALLPFATHNLVLLAMFLSWALLAGEVVIASLVKKWTITDLLQPVSFSENKVDYLVSLFEWTLMAVVPVTILILFILT